MSEYKLKSPKAMEQVIMGAHKKIEGAVLGTYEKIEKKFVDAFLEKIETPGKESEGPLEKED